MKRKCSVFCVCVNGFEYVSKSIIIVCPKLLSLNIQEIIIIAIKTQEEIPS